MKRFLFATVLCTLLLMNTWREPLTPVVAASATYSGAGAGIKTPVFPSERLSEQSEVVKVVDDFMRALREKDWSKAAKLFSADFRRANKQGLLNGSLLNPAKRGKSVHSILADPNATVGRVSIRGDKAWAQIQAGSGFWGQIGRCALELVKEKGQWRVLRFPPATAAFDALNAAHDGVSAGRWFKSMLSDGNFTPQEKAEIAKVLDAYYGMCVQMEWKIEGRRPLDPSFADITIEQLTQLADDLKAQPDRILAGITFWRKPREDVLPVSQALAKQAVRQIYEDLEAAKDRFPELAKLDKEHVIFGDDGFAYRAAPPQPKGKSFPTIGVWIAAPYLGSSQVTFPRMLFPQQRLAVTRCLGMADEQTKTFVQHMIEKDIESLVSFERVLGGEPVRDNWRQGG